MLFRSLIRRNIADADMAFFSTWCPAGTRIQALVKVEGHRWAIEDSFETAKNELGRAYQEFCVRGLVSLDPSIRR